MALYDHFVQRLRTDPDDAEGDDLVMRAAYIIAHLQQVVRGYNQDDAIFDDEKTKKDS